MACVVQSGLVNHFLDDGHVNQDGVELLTVNYMGKDSIADLSLVLVESRLELNWSEIDTVEV